jgi:lipopolysaccharide transport system ATP-binding protein
VKRYSSGMYVRLAFAVAAHLEPEILIVDEVLAVGDASFQKKCLGKMNQVTDGGRTVLFVSHNMPAVQALCDHAIYLRGGRVEATGEIGPMVQQYLGDTRDDQVPRVARPRNFGAAVRLTSLELRPHMVESGQPLRFKLGLLGIMPATITDLSILIYSDQGTRLALLDLRGLGLPKRLAADEAWQINGTINAIPFVEGDYRVGLTINTGEFFENVLDLTSFTVGARSSQSGCAPYQVVYRGVVELDHIAESISQVHQTCAALPVHV